MPRPLVFRLLVPTFALCATHVCAHAESAAVDVDVDGDLTHVHTRAHTLTDELGSPARRPARGSILPGSCADHAVRAADAVTHLARELQRLRFELQWRKHTEMAVQRRERVDRAWKARGWDDEIDVRAYHPRAPAPPKPQPPPAPYLGFNLSHYVREEMRTHGHTTGCALTDWASALLTATDHVVNASVNFVSVRFQPNGAYLASFNTTLAGFLASRVGLSVPSHAVSPTTIMARFQPKLEEPYKVLKRRRMADTLRNLANNTGAWDPLRPPERPWWRRLVDPYAASNVVDHRDSVDNDVVRRGLLHRRSALERILNHPFSDESMLRVARVLLRGIGIAVLPVRLTWELAHLAAGTAFGDVSDLWQEFALVRTCNRLYSELSATAAWALHVVWDTGQWLAAWIVSPEDSTYDRAEVVILDQALATIDEILSQSRTVRDLGIAAAATE